MHQFKRLHHNEQGMLALTNVVAMMLCAMLIALVMNVGVVIQRKILIQNTADQVAYSGAVWQARSMNALTATNHVIGEMLGMVIVHHAVGGDELDNHADDQAPDENEELDTAYQVLMGTGYPDSSAPAYDTVSADVNAGAAVLKAKKELKELLTKVYYAKAAAWLMQQSGFPPVVAAGKALEAAMHILELKIWQEYQVLNLWEGAAQALVGLKTTMRDVMLPYAKEYTGTIVEMTPSLAEEAAERIAESNGMQGLLFPINHPLPVVPDPFRDLQSPPPLRPMKEFPPMPNDVPDGGGIAHLEVLVDSGGDYTFPDVLARHFDPNAAISDVSCNCPSVAADNMRHQIVKTSQLARATFPWVNYHREPIIDILEKLTPLSHAAKHYKDHTDGFSKTLCDELQTDWHALWLYVLDGYQPPDKGFEEWNFPQYSDKADELFTVIGMAHLPPPPVLGFKVFQQAHDDGMLCYSQAMIYNANEQEQPYHRIDLDCKRIVPIIQGNTGWDTLNWHPGSNDANSNCPAGNHEPQRNRDENRPFELIGTRTNHHYPKIKVNWQVKLVPVTSGRLRSLKEESLSAPFSNLVEQIPENIASSLRTH